MCSGAVISGFEIAVVLRSGYEISLAPLAFLCPLFNAFTISQKKPQSVLQKTWNLAFAPFLMPLLSCKKKPQSVLQKTWHLPLLCLYYLANTNHSQSFGRLASVPFIMPLLSCKKNPQSVQRKTLHLPSFIPFLMPLPSCKKKPVTLLRQTWPLFITLTILQKKHLSQFCERLDTCLPWPLF